MYSLQVHRHLFRPLPRICIVYRCTDIFSDPCVADAGDGDTRLIEQHPLAKGARCLLLSCACLVRAHTWAAAACGVSHDMLHHRSKSTRFSLRPFRNLQVHGFTASLAICAVVRGLSLREHCVHGGFLGRTKTGTNVGCWRYQFPASAHALVNVINV